MFGTDEVQGETASIDRKGRREICLEQGNDGGCCDIKSWRPLWLAIATFGPPLVYCVGVYRGGAYLSEMVSSVARSKSERGERHSDSETRGEVNT
jgi:hypothetical protein